MTSLSQLSRRVVAPGCLTRSDSLILLGLVHQLAVARYLDPAGARQLAGESLKVVVETPHQAGVKY